MAGTEKNTKAKTTTAKRGRPSKAQKKKASIHRAWSIVMFAVGVLLFAIAIVPGESVWSFVRENLLFGIFGTSVYIVPFIIIYIGVLTAKGNPIKLKTFEAVIFVLILSGFIYIFFEPDIATSNFFSTIVELHIDGKTSSISGGVISGIVGLPLVVYLGAVPSKITITLLAIVLFMFLTDTTPYDIYKKTKETALQQKEELAKQLEEQKQIKQQKQEEKQKIIEETAKQQALPKVEVFDYETDYAQTKKNEIEIKQEFATSFDEVKQIKSVEQQKIEDIMKKFEKRNVTKEAAVQNPIDINPFVEEPVVENAVVQNPTLTQIEKKENTLTKEEKLAIKPLSEEVVQETPKAYIYAHPPVSLFDQSMAENTGNIERELKTNAQRLVETLESFGVKTQIIDISRGPSVTRYELQPLAGVKISKITNLADDIALNLAASGVRIEAPIPNKAAVGIEVPNKQSSAVNIRTIFESRNFIDAKSPLSIALGMDIAGNEIVADLTKMPHLLIAGSTGSGKSVCVNAIITSFIHKSSPEDVKLILIDPKVVELADYNGIPHLMMPVVTEPKKAAGALGSAVAEMEKRYRLFAENSVRDIKTYNQIAQDNPELEHMPYIAVIIDELADLMMVSGKEVEDYICRLAQKARAAGIHLIVATQRPSVDVITGLIKANIPSRIAFAVSSQIDSRTILDSAGAEKLLGMGDMLYLPIGSNKPIRIQGTYVKDKEIAQVMNFIKKDFNPNYNDEMIENMEKMATKEKGYTDTGDNAKDEMLNSAIEVVVDAGQASTSFLQRKLRLGYSRAARIIDEMEEMGIIGPSEGSKPRQVLISKNQWIEMKLNTQD